MNALWEWCKAAWCTCVWGKRGLCVIMHMCSSFIGLIFDPYDYLRRNKAGMDYDWLDGSLIVISHQRYQRCMDLGYGKSAHRFFFFCVPTCSKTCEMLFSKWRHFLQWNGFAKMWGFFSDVQVHVATMLIDIREIAFLSNRLVRSQNPTVGIQQGHLLLNTTTTSPPDVSQSVWALLVHHLHHPFYCICCLPCYNPPIPFANNAARLIGISGADKPGILETSLLCRSPHLIYSQSRSLSDVLLWTTDSWCKLRDHPRVIQHMLYHLAYYPGRCVYTFELPYTWRYNTNMWQRRRRKVSWRSRSCCYFVRHASPISKCEICW